MYLPPIPNGPLVGPGPLAYGLKPLVGHQDHCLSKKSGPAFSFRPRHLPTINKNPGPFEYNVSDTLTSRGKRDAPAITLKGRTTESRLKHINPGPGAYNSSDKCEYLSTKRSAPAPTLGPRTKVPDYRCAPPPTAYGLPINSASGLGDITKRNAPSWSFRPGAEFGGPHYEGSGKSVPAPTIYKCPEPSVYMKKAGCFTLAPRTKRPHYNTSLSNPGPGAYNTGGVWAKGGKGPSMGSRHSQHMMLILHPNDCI